MQQRIEAMIAAVDTVQPPLEKFYGLLNDDQKVRLNALGQDQRSKSAQKTGGSLAQTCGATQAGVTDWPVAEIDARLHPTDAQRASLTALQNASAKAEDLLKTSCQTDDALTPPARLAVAGKRLQVMLQAITTVRPALDDFYGKLTDEQKAKRSARAVPACPASQMPRRRTLAGAITPASAESSGISWPSGGTNPAGGVPGAPGHGSLFASGQVGRQPVENLWKTGG
jgi:hypothetical protein